LLAEHLAREVAEACAALDDGTHRGRLLRERVATLECGEGAAVGVMQVADDVENRPLLEGCRPAPIVLAERAE